MNDSDYQKYNESYSRYWFRFLNFNIYDAERGRTLTKGELHNLEPDICNQLADGAELPKRFKLVPREQPKKTVLRHGEKYVPGEKENHSILL